MKHLASASLLLFAATCFAEEPKTAAAPAKPERIALWNNHAPLGDGRFEQAEAWITVHRPAQGNGAAAVICPGGGYGGLVTGAEGHGIAEWLNRHGIVGVVLEYRLPAGRSFVPLLDAQRALRTVRAGAKDWGVDPSRIGIVGFSAGGHLASTAGTHFDEGDANAADAVDRVSCRPDFLILVYPVVTMGDKTHKGSRNNLLGKAPSSALVELFSNEKQVNARTPPAFLAHALDDKAVPADNSKAMYQALQTAKVPARYLELPSGGHGLNGYKGPMWDAWQKQSLEWLAELKLIPQAEAPMPQAASVETPLFLDDGQLKLEADNGSGGEGPAWNPALGLLTSGQGHIYCLDRRRQSAVYRQHAGTNGLLFDGAGRLLACEAEPRRITRTELDGTITVLTDRYEEHRYNQPNDLTVDSKGRIYFSDPRYGSREGMEMVDEQGQTIEGVYRIDVDGRVTRIVGRELERPNGVLVSADDCYLFVADNNNNADKGARKLWRFDLRADGTVDFASRKLLHDWGTGRGPDGLKQDQQGRLYVAAGLNKPNPPYEPAEDKKGGIYVFDVEGKLLDFLPVPRDEVTNCAFGGDDLQTLYITAGGALFSIRCSTPGRVVWPKAD